MTTLVECQDRCFQTDLEPVCKSIKTEMTDSKLKKGDLQEIKSSLDITLIELKNRNFNLSRVYLERTLSKVKKCKEGKAVNTHMGLFGLFKGKSEKQEKSQNEILDKEEKLTEQTIADLEEKIASLFDMHTKLSDQLAGRVRQCSTLDRNGNQYKHIRQQAMILLPRIKTIEQQINMYARMLENSSRYQAMLEMGKATIELKKLMPDISRTEALMDLISSETQEISDDLANLSSGIDAFENNVNKATGIQAFSSDEFDNQVSENIEKNRLEKEKKERSEKAISKDPITVISEQDNESGNHQEAIQEEGLT